MFNWKDRKYVNPRKKIFKNLDTEEILNLEVQDDEDNISEESDTPLTAHCLNMAQQELIDDMSKTFVGTNITAPTVKGTGIINKVRKECWQETRDGRNKLNALNLDLVNQATVSMTDNILTVSSTTRNTSPYVSYVFNVKTNDVVRIKGILLDADCRLYFQEFINDKWKTVIDNGGAYKGGTEASQLTYTVPSNITKIRALVYAKTSVPDVDVSARYKDLILTINNENLAYEPYGAMPSSGFPAKVHCLGDDKNLLDISTAVDLSNGATSITQIDKGLNVSGLWGVAFPFEYDISKNNTFILSADCELITKGFYTVPKIRLKYEDNTYSDYFDIGKPITATKNITDILIYVSNGVSQAEFNITNIKLQKGAIATEWSPYGCGTVVNKSTNINLWNDNEVTLVRGITFNNGIYSANDNDNRDELQYKIQQYDVNNKYLGVVTEKAKKISNAGVYYFTTTKVQNAKFIRIANAGKTNEFWLRHSLDGIKVGEKFTVVLNVIDTTVGASKFKDIMLLKGEYTADTLPDYVPCEEDTQTTYLKEPLCGIGGVYDELDLSKGDIIRRFGKKVLDGTENWARFWGDYGTHLFRITNLNIPLLSDKNVIGCMCNQYRAVSWDGSSGSLWSLRRDSDDDCLIAIQYYSTDKSLAIKDSRFTTADELKTWLAEQYANGTPVEVIYELDEPVVEHIDCFDKIKQFEGQTTIFNTDEAELECTLTNNTAIAQINQNLQKIEEMIAGLKAGE